MVSDKQWRQRYELFVARYHGRQDAIGLQCPDRTFHPVRGGLSYRRFRQHIRGSSTYAIYNRDDTGGVSFNLFDLDVFPRVPRPWEQWMEALSIKKKQAQALLNALEAMGISLNQVMVEFPTVGFHVLLFMAEPLPAPKAKLFAHLARDRAGLRFETPFYPSETGGRGDLVPLPLRRNQITGRRSNFVRDLSTFDPSNYSEEPDFVPLETVNPVSSETIQSSIDALTQSLYRRVANLSDVPPGTVRLVEDRGKRLLLVNKDGQISALSELCPHAGAPLSRGRFSNEYIECAWHSARFRVDNGELVSGPAHTGLTQYAVKVENGDILVGPSLV